MFTRAITRQPGAQFDQGLTTAGLGRPDYGVMMAQHRRYEELLRGLGLAVEVLEPLPGYPDAYFVEDVAVVIPEVAVITRPGAPSRRGETAAIAPILAGYRPLAHIEPPGTLEGGDVLMVGRHFFIGLSERTNREGARQLASILALHGYSWAFVPVAAGLHLKSSVTYVGNDTLLLTANLASQVDFANYRLLILAEDEAHAANTLLVNDSLIVPDGCPRTRDQLTGLNRPVIELEVSEARKMDGGLTCMSLRF